MNIQIQNSGVRPTRDMLLIQILSKIRVESLGMGFPHEIIFNIFEHLTGHNPSAVLPQSAGGSPSTAATPPKNGSSPLMALPAELIRKVFATSLPAKDVVHHPTCEDESNPHRDSTHAKEHKVRRNRISDLMTLNSSIRDLISEVLYEERFFTIHVHEGLRHGGVEFLNVGRQPLNYQDNVQDRRFDRFGKDDKYGFRRLKKIRIQIYPAGQNENTIKHTALNTYFVNLALCRLIERPGEEKTRITSIEIEFVQPKRAMEYIGRAAIHQAEQYWWDPAKNKPRETSIHSLSNIELVLRPFANLTACHNVSITLPQYVRTHGPTLTFVEDLERSMTSKLRTMFMDDDSEMRIESARSALEDHIYKAREGKDCPRMENLTEEEMLEEDIEDGGEAYNKHSLSPFSSMWAGNKRHKPTKTSYGSELVNEDDEDDDLEEALRKSIEEQEEMDIQMATAESLGIAPDNTADAPSQDRYGFRPKTKKKFSRGQRLSSNPESPPFSLGPFPPPTRFEGGLRPPNLAPGSISSYSADNHLLSGAGGLSNPQQYSGPPFKLPSEAACVNENETGGWKTWHGYNSPQALTLPPFYPTFGAASWGNLTINAYGSNNIHGQGFSAPTYSSDNYGNHQALWQQASPFSNTLNHIGAGSNTNSLYNPVQTWRSFAMSEYHQHLITPRFVPSTSTFGWLSGSTPGNSLGTTVGTIADGSKIIDLTGGDDEDGAEETGQFGGGSEDENAEKRGNI